jgi:hypothetical protein
MPNKNDFWAYRFLIDANLILRRIAEDMFCPGCGLEEVNSNQFCRACGTDLRTVRLALERPDDVAASAAAARGEIGRAIAAKIRETESASDLKTVVERVLPEIEKFLESPAEKRRRLVHKGLVVSSIGAGAAIGFFLAAVLMGQSSVFFFVGAGIVTLFIGFGLILSALLFTVPKKELADKSGDAQSQRELDAAGGVQTNELKLPESKSLFSSVTEETTRHLKKNHIVSRD